MSSNIVNDNPSLLGCSLFLLDLLNSRVLCLVLNRLYTVRFILILVNVDFDNDIAI